MPDETKPVGLESRLATWAIRIVCVVLIVYGVGILLMRAMLPVQLGIFEGKTLCAAVDFATGNKIYRDPAQYGAADIYTPLYPILLSAFHGVLPPSFMVGRLLTMLMSVATAGLIILYFIRRNPRQAGMITLILGALFCSIAWHTEWFFSALKSDVMCHLLWLGGLAVLIRRGAPAAVVGALLIVLAFFAKQTAIFVLPGALLFLLIESRRDLVVFAGSIAALFWITMEILKGVAGDWMPFYIFGRLQIQASQMFPVSKLMSYAFSLRWAPLTLGAAVLGVAMVRELWQVRPYRLALLCAPFLLGGSILTAASEGGGYNSLIPGLYGLLFLAGYGVERAVSAMRQQPAVGWLLVAGLALQMDASWPYNLSKARGKFDQDFVRIVEFLQSQKGAMYCPSHNVITLLAGRHDYDDRVLAEYIRPKMPEAYERIVSRMNSGAIDWLILDKHEKDAELMQPDVLNQYEHPIDFESWTVLRKKTH